MPTAAGYFATGLEQVRRSWSWFLVLGALLIVLGVLCVGKAQTATAFSILVLGWILAISGVLWLVDAFRALSWHGFFFFLLNGIIRGATGFLLLRHPDAGAAGVSMLLASLFIVSGLFRAIATGVIRFPRWGWTVCSGFVSFVLGTALLASWSSASMYFVGLVIGIDLIVDCASRVGFATAIHSLPKLELRKAA